MLPELKYEIEQSPFLIKTSYLRCSLLWFPDDISRREILKKAIAKCE